MNNREEQFEAVIDAGIDAMIALNMDGVITLFNLASEKMFNVQRSEAIGRNFLDILDPEYKEDVDLFITSQVNSKVPGAVIGNSLRFYITKNDASPLPVELTLSLGRHGEGKFILVILRDISELKRSEAILKDTEEQLRISQKMEAVGRLAGGVAHDFNNLLGGIIGYSDIILFDLKSEDPLRADVEEIQRAAKRAAELTRQLLAFSRSQVLKPKNFNINEVVKGAKKMLTRLIGEDIELTTELSEDLGMVRADPGQVEQVIMNLVVNARDAMPTGGKLIIGTQQLDINPALGLGGSDTPMRGPHVMMFVSDTGCGMNAEIRTKIFEPFFTTKSDGKGTGLGLSTVYGIVSQSKGTITLDSVVDEGSTFKIYLPVVDDIIADSQKEEVEKTLAQANETILVVEDEEMLLTLISRILRMNGYSVMSARHGGEALLLCEQNAGKIDLILTDVVMPQMNGMELCERLVGIQPDMKVLFMTGYTDDTMIQHGVFESDLDLIQKPFTADAIVSKVQQVISQGRSFVKGTVRENE